MAIQRGSFTLPNGKTQNLVGFDFNDGNWGATQASLKKLRGRTSLRPILLKIAMHIRRETERNFDSEGAYAGERWAPNKEPYASWKRGERSGGIGGSLNRPAKDSRVLHRYLALRRALTVKADSDHVEVITAKGRRLVVGVKGDALKVAGIQKGGQPKRRIPARDPFAFKHGFEARVYNMIENYIFDDYIPQTGSL